MIDNRVEAVERIVSRPRYLERIRHQHIVDFLMEDPLSA